MPVILPRRNCEKQDTKEHIGTKCRRADFLTSKYWTSHQASREQPRIDWQGHPFHFLVPPESALNCANLRYDARMFVSIDITKDLRSLIRSAGLRGEKKKKLNRRGRWTFLPEQMKGGKESRGTGHAQDEDTHDCPESSRPQWAETLVIHQPQWKASTSYSCAFFYYETAREQTKKEKKGGQGSKSNINCLAPNGVKPALIARETQSKRDHT